MNNKKFAIMCALTMSISQLFNPIYGLEMPPLQGKAAEGQNQPIRHGYRLTDIENWSPETDPNAALMRAQVPLQERNVPFAPTQANPNLSSETQFLDLNGDYSNYALGSPAYNNEFSQYAFNFWQYTDYYGGWHGAAPAGIPKELYNFFIRGDLRTLEYGVLDLPNPAYTNAAHKNGAKSIGCIFIPRAGQPYHDLLKQREDGTFPIAEKLIEMKEYFGFDGYFINQETDIAPEHIELYKAFTKTLRDAGVYTQWYDIVDDETGKMSYQPQLIPSHSSFVQDEDLGRVNDSIFMNYNWNSPNGWNNGDSDNQIYIKASVEEAKRRGIDPFETVFMGIEAGMGRYGGTHNSSRNMDVILDKETGNPLTSIASLGSNFVQNRLDWNLGGDFHQQFKTEDDKQWMIAERERMWYTGVKIDATNTNEQPGYSRPDVGANKADQWTGISRYIAERSVVDGTTFVTNFRTGHGMEYVAEGQVVSEEEWSNMNLQDILPTWQWWIDTEGTKLQPDFDYGKKVDTGEKFTYTPVGGYKGGSSLVVSGTLDAKNFLHLYKTDLEVTPTSQMNIVFNKASNTDKSKMQAGLIFKDQPEEVVYLDIPNTGVQTNGWITETLDLSAYKGREIAKIGLAFVPGQEKVEQYQMNIGEIQITDSKNYTPAMPKHFEIQEKYNTGEMVVSWEKAGYEAVKEYQLYAELKNGTREFLGGTYDSIYYIKSINPHTQKLKLVAIGQDGSESPAAEIVYDESQYVQNLQVTSVTDGLKLSWTNPKVDYNKITLELGFTDGRAGTYTMEVGSDVQQANLVVPSEDGNSYILRVQVEGKDGQVISKTSTSGKMKDLYSAPFEGNYYIAKDTKGNEILGVDVPSSKDWSKMYITYDGVIQHPSKPYAGEEVDGFIRGYHELHGLAIPKNGTVIGITLEDYKGNISETSKLIFKK